MINKKDDADHRTGCVVRSVTVTPVPEAEPTP